MAASPENRSFTTTLSPTTTDGFSSAHQALSSSLSSLTSSASARRSASYISKTYRQSSTLFLTRRLPEALSTILPLITPPQPGSEGAGGTTEPAPVAKASRNTRTKVWTLYIAILNAIVALDPDEGKETFGSQEWRSICAKVRDGGVWEEVVMNGYHGVEGDVDSDVVINLCVPVSTCFLPQICTDKTTQGDTPLDPRKDTDPQSEAARELPRRLIEPESGFITPLLVHVSTLAFPAQVPI